MTTIALNAFEFEVCWHIAKERQAENERNNIIDKRINKTKSAVQLNYEGLIGEFVVAKYLNIYPDFTTNVRQGGRDLKYKIWKLDAKNLTQPNYLLAPNWKKLGQSDIYIHIYGHNPYEIIGWAFETELIKPKNLNEIDFPIPSYALPACNLHPIENMLDLEPEPEQDIPEQVISWL
jgi:hypothetical protein